MVVVPVDLPFPTDRIVGADAMHVALCAILRTSATERTSSTTARRPRPTSLGWIWLPSTRPTTDAMRLAWRRVPLYHVRGAQQGNRSSTSR